jgi:CTP-dependent riboflavin kinase
LIGHDEAASLARIVLALRNKRAEHLPVDLLGEQAWGILLAMFVADAESERLTAAEACARAGGSSAVAMRWLHALEQYGLVACEMACESRQLVALTPAGISAIEACMEDARRWMVSKPPE